MKREDIDGNLLMVSEDDDEFCDGQRTLGL